jgi:hypothetical protein
MLRPVSSEIKIDETEIQAAKVRRHLSSKGISCFLIETSMQTKKKTVSISRYSEHEVGDMNQAY